MRAMSTFQPGQRVHLVDKKGRQYALTLKAGDRFQHSGETVPHDDLIGRPDGTMVRFSGGKTMIALMPTLAEYTLKMPRGAQVLYPKDIAMILMWADVYPGASVFEAGVGSAALTLGLLRAVGDRAQVVSICTKMRQRLQMVCTGLMASSSPDRSKVARISWPWNPLPYSMLNM